MIRTVSDFLEELKEKGQELIKKYEIVEHPVLIGDMYEGLTQDLLHRAIFDGLNLKIVGGKIRNGRGDLSGEIDCMIVQGEGEKLPFTEKYIYHFSNVIAVVEVKKSLYSNSLEDSFDNLRTVINISREPEKDGEDYLMPALRDAWRSMFKFDLPKRSELASLSEREQQIYHTLLMEAYFPLRIVFGYFGFKKEFNLREAFANFLANKVASKTANGFGVGSLPSLIICGKNSIIKINGMPYSMPFTNEEFYWPIYATSSSNPIHKLLEFVWTRLSYKFSLSSTIFGSDFNFEGVHKYINCKVAKDNQGNLGWAFKYSPFTDKILSESKGKEIEWTPVFLNQKQFIVIMQLCQNEVLNIAHPEFVESITKDGTGIKEFIKELVETGLVYEKNSELRFLTYQCQTIILPDGRYCAGENRSGEIMHWLEKYMNERKEKK